MQTSMAPLLLVALLSLNVAFVAGETICLGKPADVLNFKIWPEACVNATEGTVCTAVCNDRYTSLPAPTSTCQANGTWSAPSPICQPTCAGPPEVALPNGAWTGCNSNSLRGFWCNGTCAQGFAGTPQVYCEGPQLINAAAGTFTSGWTTVTGSCGTPPASPVCPTRPATVTNSPGFPTSCAGALQDSVCTAPCNANSVYWYNATGYPQVKCKSDGTWSTAFPATCIALKVQYLNPKCMTSGTYCTKNSDCCNNLNCTLSGPVSPVTGVQQRRCGSGIGIASLGLGFSAPSAAGDLVSGDAGIVGPDTSAGALVAPTESVTPAGVVEEQGVGPTAAAPITTEPVAGRRLRGFGGV